MTEYKTDVLGKEKTKAELILDLFSALSALVLIVCLPFYGALVLMYGWNWILVPVLHIPALQFYVYALALWFVMNFLDIGPAGVTSRVRKDNHPDLKGIKLSWYIIYSSFGFYTMTLLVFYIVSSFF